MRVVHQVMSDNSVSPIDIERQPTTEIPSLVDANRLDKEFVLERKTSLQYKKVKLKKIAVRSDFATPVSKWVSPLLRT